jgi:hypothetical protein
VDRELILAALTCLLCGPALVAAGALVGQVAPGGPAHDLERSAWRKLWLPLVPAALILAFLIGWAAQEPEDAEAAGAVVFGVAALFALVVVRALVRAARATRLPERAPVAMTIGFWRPRVVLAPELAARLDARALRAAIAHEAAHVRHRDPLRLWLAQLATDLQWPAGAARARLADWREALELARDAEACEEVDGSDLAAALITAAQLARGGMVGAAALLVPERTSAAFADRIHRLLDGPPPRGTRSRGGWRGWLALGGALGGAAAAGAVYGEALVSLLPRL